MLDLIRRRNNQKYLMQLMIVQNPWTKEPQRLISLLKGDIRMTAISDDINKSNEILDKSGINRLKRILKKNPKSKIGAK